MRLGNEDHSQQFADILVDALDSFLGKNDETSADEWAREYLAEKITEKTTEEIDKISDKIVDTIRTQTESILSLNNAEKSGKSIEAWFVEETAPEDGSFGKQAELLSEAKCALTDETLNDDFSDDNWNKFSVKELASEVITNAVETTAQSVFDELSDTISSEGICALKNADTIISALSSGLSEGIKTAVATAVTIASEKGILPRPVSAFASALISGISVEKLSVEMEVGNGTMSSTEGIKATQDAAVATTVISIKEYKEEIGEKAGSLVGSTIGSVFGPTGSIVGERIGAVIGRACGTEICDLISSGINKICYAVNNTLNSVRNSVSNFLFG